jgi:hypothetical protein
VPDDLIGGRSQTPEGVLAADADCELELDYVIARYLSRDDFCGVLIEDVLLGPQLGHDKKLDLLRKILKRHQLTFPPLNTLAGELAVLRRFRNELTHTVAYRGDPLQRIKRSGGKNELITITRERIAEHLTRGMHCQSALHFVPLYVEQHPAADTLASADGPPAPDPGHDAAPPT